VGGKINRRNLMMAMPGAAAGMAAIQPAWAQSATPSAAGLFPGAEVGPDDPRYPTLVRGFNLRWVGTPAYVAVCGDTAQVVSEVQRALDSGRRITVRGGGHCYEDFVSNNDGGVIINLSPMRAVSRDAETGWYGVEGGATLWDVFQQLYVEYGVTIPGGSCGSVGAGGHITGGGYGLLSRLHGLTVDFLHAADVVVVSEAGKAEAITVSRDSTDPAEQDLLWGHLGGGGGNFGIVTRFWFKDLPQAPTDAHVMNLAWNWDDLDEGSFGQLLSNYGAFLEANSEVGSPYAGLFALMHLSQKAAGQAVMTVQYVGDEPELLDDFTAAIVDGGMATPVASRTAIGHHNTVSPTTTARSLPWLYATQTFNGSGRNQRGKYKSSYMKTAFPQEHIAALWKHLSAPEHPNPQALVQIDSYGCQINAVDAAATAIPQRSSVMKLQFQTYWTNEADDQVNIDWIRGIYDEMYGEDGPLPDEVMDGAYINYPDVDLVDWPLLYYKDNYARLQAVKARWDPLDVFNHRQSIRLP
jgi:FAD/FMN-containing dehydrogenase